MPQTPNPHSRSRLLHPCRITHLQTVQFILRLQEGFPLHQRHSSARREAVLGFLPFDHLLDLKPELQASLKIRKKGRGEEGREGGKGEGRGREEWGGQRKGNTRNASSDFFHLGEPFRCEPFLWLSYEQFHSISLVWREGRRIQWWSPLVTIP